MDPGDYRDVIAAATGLPAEVRQYPDRYAVVTLLSPTGVPLVSFSFAARPDGWKFVGTVADLDSGDFCGLGHT
jgi:hypothetical protein